MMYNIVGDGNILVSGLLSKYEAFIKLVNGYHSGKFNHIWELEIQNDVENVVTLPNWVIDELNK